MQADIHWRRDLADATVQSMYRLFAGYYDATSETLFRRDLAGKDHVILLHDADGKLCGFSTLAVVSFEFRGAPVRVIFSGDTIIAREHWGEQALPKAFCALAARIKAQAPAAPLYWFLIVKGHRTYRYLPIFARSYYPTWRYPTPEREQALMHFLAQEKFGAAYDAASGTIRFDASRGQLKPPWAQVPQELLAKPDVRFFLERNPGHAQGDELVCLTELCAQNLRSHALRAFADATDHERLAATA